MRLALVEVAERVEHPLHRVERTDRVIGRERALVRPRVPYVGQLEHAASGSSVRTRARTPRSTWSSSPLKQEGHVASSAAWTRGCASRPLTAVEPVVAVEPGPGLLALRAQAVTEQVERLRDALGVGHHHRAGPLAQLSSHRSCCWFVLSTPLRSPEVSATLRSVRCTQPASSAQPLSVAFWNSRYASWRARSP